MSREINDVDDIGRGYANLSSTLLICGEGRGEPRRGAGGRRLGPERGRDGRLRAVHRRQRGRRGRGAGTLGRGGADGGRADGRSPGGLQQPDRDDHDHGPAPYPTRSPGRRRALLEEGRALVEPLLEAQFTGQLYVGLVEFALTSGRPDDAAEAAAEGIRRLDRTGDRYYESELLAVAARGRRGSRRDRPSLPRYARRGRGDRLRAVYRDRLRSWVDESSGRTPFGGRSPRMRRRRGRGPSSPG